MKSIARATALAEPGVRALLSFWADVDTLVTEYQDVPLAKRWGILLDGWGETREKLDPDFDFAAWKAARRKVREAGITKEELWHLK